MRFRMILVVAMMAITSSAFAQFVIKDDLSNLDKQERTRVSRDMELQKRFPYWWEHAGRDPVVTSNELKCIGSITVGFNEIELTGMLKGLYDKCSAKGSLPISKRLRRRVSMLLFRNDSLSDAKWAGILEQVAAGQIVEKTIGPGSTELDLSMANSAIEPGAFTTYPPTPMDFTIHGYTTTSIKMDEGPYAGKAVSLFFTRSFEKDGSFKEPCVNISGKNVFTSLATASTAVPAELGTVRPAAPLPIVREEHGKKKSFFRTPWPYIIGGAIVACAILCRSHDKDARIVNEEKTKGGTGVLNPGGSPISAPGNWSGSGTGISSTGLSIKTYSSTQAKEAGKKDHGVKVGFAFGFGK